MNRKLARWTAGVVAAAALPVAALAPAASSASAATLPNTATVAAKTVVWLPFSGYGSPYPTLAADFQARRAGGTEPSWTPFSAPPIRRSRSPTSC